jgi:hypothetical protein
MANKTHLYISLANLMANKVSYYLIFATRLAKNKKVNDRFAGLFEKKTYLCEQYEN